MILLLYNIIHVIITYNYKGRRGLGFRRGLSSMRSLFRDLPNISGMFFDFHALLQDFPTFVNNSPARNKANKYFNK